MGLDGQALQSPRAPARESIPFAIELVDDREAYGEDRYLLIGMTKSRVLVVVYVLRDTRNRILSARKAEPNERRAYHEQIEP